MAANHDRLTLAEVEQALGPDLPPEDVKAVMGLLGAYLKRRYEKDANETTMLAYASYMVNGYDYDTDPTDKNGQGEHPTTVDEWAMLNTRATREGCASRKRWIRTNENRRRMVKCTSQLI